jgi:multiple sugar transport system substrate-binding protein
MSSMSRKMAALFVITVAVVAAVSSALTWYFTTTSLMPAGPGATPTKPKLTVAMELGTGAADITVNFTQRWAEKHNVTIEFINAPDADVAYGKMVTAGQAGETPYDVVYMWGDFIPALGDKKLVLPLDNYISTSELESITPSTLTPMYYKNTLYAFPYLDDNQILWYRKDLISEPPRTAQELLSMSEQIYAQTNKHVYGYVDSWSEASVPLVCKYIVWLTAAGGKLWDYDRNVPAWNSSEGVTALDWMRTLAQSNATDPSSWTNEDWVGEGDAFAAGNAAMMLNWAGVDVPLNPETSNVTGKIAWTTVPAIKTSGTVSAPDGMVVSSYTKYPELAIELAKFIALDYPLTVERVKNSPYVPSLISALQDPGVVKTLKDRGLSDIFKAITEQKTNYPVGEKGLIPQWGDIVTVLGQELSAALHGEKSAQQALDDAAAKALELVR